MFSLGLRRSVRFVHTEAAPSVPGPRGSIKDVNDFMTSIGRGCQEFSDKFETWDALFTTSSRAMKADMGIPAKKRKYILGWIEKYKTGVEPYAVPTSSKKK
ncbi:hypothetical protein DM01DRAFT_1376224 [Hesseltinella vesiculosa]|uniref:Small ribosomal subunit protein mS41 n=1 Tax=Hesseltinella vesiculosa TaxID=101127 RepID=A0A1X2GBI1_9FUNG|nr:hypothetical protein DM01DRAFT_1376224 [Hesseltinella vesiculosa]